MDREQHDEWSTLERSARDALNAGNWVVRLGMFPSFSEAWMIGIKPYNRRRPDRTRDVGLEVCCRMWRRHEDAEKLRTPVERLRHPRPLAPTIQSTAATIEREQVDRIEASLEHIRIPVLPSLEVVGLDGTTYELAARGSMHGSEFQWWSHPPEAWSPLVEWWKGTWATLLDVLAVPVEQRPRID